MANPVAPVFVLSLPRSGSTLVQRVLTAHPSVATTSEPWVVLPQLYALRSRGVLAEYDHETLAAAVGAFARELPDGVEQYLGEVRRMLLRLYQAASPPGARWFIDKTPRYHLVVDELLEMFPSSPVIVLWRNPLAIVASMTASWHGGRWYPHRHGIDLYTGLEKLVAAVQRSPERILAIRYEDLITGTAGWTPIAERLSISVTEEALHQVGERRLHGPVGDPTQSTYAGLSQAPLDKWATELASPVRRRWAREYLEWIGEARLAVMGYDAAALHRDLDSMRPAVARVPGDLWAGARERVRSGLRRWQGGGAVAHEWPPGRTSASRTAVTPAHPQRDERG